MIKLRTLCHLQARHMQQRCKVLHPQPGWLLRSTQSALIKDERDDRGRWIAQFSWMVL